MGGPTYPRVLIGICGEGVWNTQILILYFNQLQYEDYDYYCIVFILYFNQLQYDDYYYYCIAFILLEYTR